MKLWETHGKVNIPGLGSKPTPTPRTHACTAGDPRRGLRRAAGLAAGRWVGVQAGLLGSTAPPPHTGQGLSPTHLEAHPLLVGTQGGPGRPGLCHTAPCPRIPEMALAGHVAPWQRSVELPPRARLPFRARRPPLTSAAGFHSPRSGRYVSRWLGPLGHTSHQESQLGGGCARRSPGSACMADSSTKVRVGCVFVEMQIWDGNQGLACLGDVCPASPPHCRTTGLELPCEEQCCERSRNGTQPREADVARSPGGPDCQPLCLPGAEPAPCSLSSLVTGLPHPPCWWHLLGPLPW